MTFSLHHECNECGDFCRPSKIAGLVRCDNCGKMQPGIIPGPEQDPATAMEAMAESGAQVPDYADVMIGWRAWALSCEPEEGEEGLLWSITHPENGPWLPREPMIAECNKARGPAQVYHDPPKPGCSCGIYAARNKGHLLGMRYHRYDEEARAMWCVIGTVSLWGGVIPGSQGWKASKAYPRELRLPYEAYRLAKPITEKYGVPVRLENILRTPNIVQH